jgi:hypothetical protein
MEYLQWFFPQRAFFFVTDPKLVWTRAQTEVWSYYTVSKVFALQLFQPLVYKFSEVNNFYWGL